MEPICWHTAIDSTLGGFLTLLSHAYQRSRICGKPVPVNAYGELPNWFENFREVFSAEISIQEGHPSSGSCKCKNLETAPPNYSLQQVVSLAKQSGLRPHIPWEPDFLKASLLRAESSGLTSFKFFHLKAPSSPPQVGEAEELFWGPALGEISKKYQVVIGGASRKDLPFIPRAIPTLRDDFGFSLPQELALLTLGFPFVATASGYCTPALFGTNPFLIYKHPLHHADSRQEDSYVRWLATEAQLFRRSAPNLFEIMRFLELEPGKDNIV